MAIHDVETDDQARGRHWRVVRVLHTPLGTEDDYQPSEQVLWQEDGPRQHFTSALHEAFTLLKHDKVELIRYERLTDRLGSANVAYHLEVRHWGSWQAVSDLTYIFRKLIALRESGHRP